MQRKTQPVCSGTSGTVGTTGLGLGLSSKVSSALDSLAATWAQVDRLRPVVQLTRPVGSFTLAEYAERYGLSRSTANGQLVKLLRAGSLSRTSVQEPSPLNGKLVNNWCYYPVKL